MPIGTIQQSTATGDCSNREFGHIQFFIVEKSKLVPLVECFCVNPIRRKPTRKEPHTCDIARYSNTTYYKKKKTL